MVCDFGIRLVITVDGLARLRVSLLGLVICGKAVLCCFYGCGDFVDCGFGFVGEALGLWCV